MVFSKLSAQEKDAFFGLLDEYFQSRPELFGQGGDQVSGLAGTGISTAAAASAVQRALLSANTVTGPSGGSGGSGVTASGSNTNPFTSATTRFKLATPGHAGGDLDVARASASAMTVGRVAAASLALSQAQAQTQTQGGARGVSPGPSLSPAPITARAHTPTDTDANASTGTGTGSGNGNGNGPPSLPHRATSNAPAPASALQTATAAAMLPLPGAQVDKLVTRKTGVLSSFKKQPVGAVYVPPAFVMPKSTYGPPPVRRTTSETGASAGGGASASASANAPRLVGGATRTVPPQPQRQPAAAAEEAEAETADSGEWAEVLYDYSSEDPGDLAIEAGTRVLVTARSSEDWWTGQIEGQGKEGLFPASYVKIL